MKASIYIGIKIGSLIEKFHMSNNKGNVSVINIGYSHKIGRCEIPFLKKGKNKPVIINMRVTAPKGLNVAQFIPEKSQYFFNLLILQNPLRSLHCHSIGRS